MQLLFFEHFLLLSIKKSRQVRQNIRVLASQINHRFFLFPKFQNREKTNSENSFIFLFLRFLFSSFNISCIRVKIFKLQFSSFCKTTCSPRPYRVLDYRGIRPQKVIWGHFRIETATVQLANFQSNAKISPLSVSRVFVFILSYLNKILLLIFFTCQPYVLTFFYILN